MNTRRVPGVTRNSGWQAVDAEIVRARVLAQHQDATVTFTQPERVRAAGQPGHPGQHPSGTSTTCDGQEAALGSLM